MSQLLAPQHLVFCEPSFCQDNRSESSAIMFDEFGGHKGRDLRSFLHTETRARRYTVFCDIPVLIHGPVWAFTLPSITVFECLVCYMWYAMCNVHFYSLLRYLSHLSSLHAAFHTDLAVPVTQGAPLLFLDQETLAFSLHGQCRTCNNVGVVFTLFLIKSTSIL
jgi:hypothetical protein